MFVSGITEMTVSRLRDRFAFSNVFGASYILFSDTTGFL